MEENIALGPLTTLGVGGPARYLARVETEGELVEAAEFAAARGLPVFVLGGGSNLLVSDSGFDGVVLQMAIAGPLEFVERDGAMECRVAAGVDWDAFVLAACERGLAGVECLAGIPGQVGGSPVQNTGAYGQEVAETIVSVRALDLGTGEFVEFGAAECGFGYRKSIFNSTKRGRFVATVVTFRFDPQRSVNLKYAELARAFEGSAPTPLEVHRKVREIRRGKGMLLVEGDADCRSAGSFFKNPVVSRDFFAGLALSAGLEAEAIPHWAADGGCVKLAAAWLVEQAGFHKGYRMGRAGISSRHSLAIVNLGGAKAAEIAALRDEVKRRVEERFGIRLEQEPVVVG